MDINSMRQFEDLEVKVEENDWAEQIPYSPPEAFPVVVDQNAMQMQIESEPEQDSDAKDQLCTPIIQNTGSAVEAQDHSIRSWPTIKKVKSRPSKLKTRSDVVLKPCRVQLGDRVDDPAFQIQAQRIEKVKSPPKRCPQRGCRSKLRLSSRTQFNRHIKTHTKKSLLLAGIL
jgi:hypothetical protein